MPFEQVEVEVTQEDIVGASLSQGNDPVLRAIRRTLGGSWKIHYQQVAVELDVPLRVILLPLEARLAWEDFKRGEPVQPFRFRAEVRTTGNPAI